MAVEDFGGEVGQARSRSSRPTTRTSPTSAANIARQWFDTEGVDVIVDVPTSSVALAVSQVAREKNKVFIDSGAGHLRPDRRAVPPNTVHWTYDT